MRTYRFDNPHEMDQFLQIHPAKNCYEQTDYFNSPAAIKEVRSTSNSLQKAPAPNGFVGEHLYQVLKEEIKLLLHQCQQIEHRNFFLPHTTLI